MKNDEKSFWGGRSQKAEGLLLAKPKGLNLTLTPTVLPAVVAATLRSQSSLEDDHVAWVICWSGASLRKFHTDKYSAAPDRAENCDECEYQ